MPKLGALSVLAVTAACYGGPPPDWAVEVIDSSGVTILHVPAPGSGATVTLHADREIGARAPIRNIHDAVVVDAGAVAIVDNVFGEAWLLGPDSNHVQVAGKGEGPGELRRPLAVAALHGGMLVWDPGVLQFHLYDQEGSYRSSIRQPVVGDAPAFFRRENWQRDDLRSRLVTSRNDRVEEIWLHIEDDEYALQDPGSGDLQEIPRNGYLIVIDPTTLAVDTIHRFRALTRFLSRDVASHGPPPLSSRPLWAAGNNAFAFASSDSARVEIRTRDGAVVAAVQWEATRRELRLDDRRAWVRAVFREESRSMSAGLRNSWDEERLDRAAEVLPFAGNVPQLGGLALVDRCLWIGKFDLETDSNGRGATWSYYNIITGTGGTVKVDSTAVVPLRFAQDHIIASAFTAEDLPVIRIYLLPTHVRETCR